MSLIVVSNMRLLKYYTTLVLVLVQFYYCTAQNLVPNPSFEVYNKCPTGISGLEYSPGYITFPTVDAWINPVQAGSADYFNNCAPQTTGASVPNNAFGYQPARNGGAYIGIIAWEGNNQGTNTTYAEYVQCKLTQPLTAGTSYCVTFYVNNGVSPATYNYVGIDAVGVNFSSTKASQTIGYTMSLPYSVQNAGGRFLTDTANWTRVSGIYKATGGEEWMTIGWFDNGSVPVFQPIYHTSPNPTYDYRCYLYMDDVSVVEMTNTDTFYTSQDSTFCTPNNIKVNLQSNAQLAEYRWSNGTTTEITQVTDTGVYWCIANSGCITYIDTFKVRHEPAPILDLGKELVDCNNQPVQIDAKYPGSEYYWSTGDTTERITVTQPGVYSLTISDKCGIQTDSVEVFIQSPTPAPTAVDTTICQFTQNAVINVLGDNITWYTHEKGNIGSELQIPIITIKPGEYNLYITQTIGKCESEKAPVGIEVTYTPHEQLGDKVVMCENNLKMIGTDQKDVSYKWNTGSTACCVLPERDGLYKLATQNDCGSFIDSLWVYHISCDDCIVFPNAFKAVTNSTNNIFRPIIKCPVSEFNIKIFNRWGNKVYESNNVQDGWRGRYNYDWAPMGTYVYIVEYRAKDKLQKQIIKGNVTLLR